MKALCILLMLVLISPAGAITISQYGKATTNTFQLVTYGPDNPNNEVIYSYGLAPGKEVVKVYKTRITPGNPITFTVKKEYEGKVLYVNARQVLPHITNENSNEIKVVLTKVKPKVCKKCHRWH